MKRIKYTVACILSALTALSMGGCVTGNDSSGSWENPFEDLLTQTATFTASYDYGFHQENKATLLLDGCTPFFNFEEYGVAPVVAGDELTVHYKGSMITLDCYPGRVNLDGEIVKVEKTNHAQIISDCYKQGEQIYNESGFGFVDLPQYVLHKDGSFTPFAEMEEGAELFVAWARPNDPGVDYLLDSSRIMPTALYSYDPTKKAEEQLSPGLTGMAWANWSGSEKIKEEALNGEMLDVYSSIHYPIYKCDTPEDFADFKEKFSGVFTMDGTWDEVGSFNEITAHCDEEFFAEKTLFIIYVGANSCTYRYGVRSAVRQGDRVVVTVDQLNDPKFGDEAMGGWLLTAAMDDADLEGVTEYDSMFGGVRKYYE